MNPSDGERRLYSLYGLTLATDFPFASHLVPGSGEHDVVFSLVSSRPTGVGDPEGVKPIYSSPVRAGDGKRPFYAYPLGDCLLLRWPTMDFYLWPDRIVCHPSNPERHRAVEWLLLGIVFACWLEWRGVPALHASAVVVDDRGVAFLAIPGSGKSSLASSLMWAGYPLLTDDVLPLRYTDGAYLGYPAYPEVRMWPDQAQHFLDHFEDLPFARPFSSSPSKRRVPVGKRIGTFCAEPRPLSCLYLPQRRDPADWGTGIEITPVPSREALMNLINHSFVVGIVEALAMHAHRLGFFARMVPQVPVRWLIYPSGFDNLSRVRQAILDDLSSLPSSREEG